MERKKISQQSKLSMAQGGKKRSIGASSLGFALLANFLLCPVLLGSLFTGYSKIKFSSDLDEGRVMDTSRNNKLIEASKSTTCMKNCSLINNKPQHASQSNILYLLNYILKKQ